MDKSTEFSSRQAGTKGKGKAESFGTTFRESSCLPAKAERATFGVPFSRRPIRAAIRHHLVF